MDWPKFDFCVLLWVLYVSKALGDSTALISTKDPKCQWGDILPKKDECNTCICFEGDVHCTNLPCTRQRTGETEECYEGQPVIKLDECNECYCFDGKLDCSDLICIRGSKCSDGQEIPRPDHCNICKCFEGHIVCTNYECNPRSKHRPYLPANDTSEFGAIKDAELPKECEENDFIPPPPPPFDCNKCVCLNHQVFCSMESCTDDVPDVNKRFNLQNEPKDNLEVHDKKISVDPYLNLFYKNYDKTPTKLVHTHAYNGFHQEIKVHSKNLSQDTSKLIKALASSLDNPVLGQIGERIKSSSSNFNSRELTKLSGGQGGQNYRPNSPHSNEIQAKYSPNLSDNPLHSLSSLITSGSQSNETILVIPTKQKPFAANQQLHLNTPYSSESADLTFEQKHLYYPANHPSNFSPRDHYKTFDSRNKDLINQSTLQNNPVKNNVDKQLSPPYNLADGQLSPSNFYKLNQGQHLDYPNKYSNASSSHPIYNPSHDHEKFPTNVNDLPYAQPHNQLVPNTAYRPYQNEPIQNGLHPNHNNHYPISNQTNQISPSQYEFDQNYTNPFGHQNMLSDQDGNYPRHPYKLNPMNQNHYQMNPSQNSSSLVVGSDNRGSQYSPLYTSIEQNPTNYNAHHNNALSHNILGPEPQHQPTSTMPSQDKHPTQMRLPEKEVLSLQDINYNSKYNFKLPRPSLYNIYPAETNNGAVHSQESNKSPLAGNDFTQNSFRPEHKKNGTILDDRRPHNLPYPQFEPNLMYYHNQQFTPPHNGNQSDQNKQQLHSPYEPNQTQTNNIYQPHYPKSPENKHEFGQNYQTQHKNAHLQQNLPQSSIGPNQEERLSTLDNNGNRYNLTNSHYKTHSSLTYLTQYVPNHSGQSSDQSPNTSYLDDRFNLHHPPLNSVELKGRGKGPNTEYNQQNNLIRPGLLSIQRGNEVDPTIVKVYQYLNQPKNIYPPKQNEIYPHIISNSLSTNNYPALHQENLEDPPRSSMSVEDDKNSIYNSEYPTSLHSQSPVWDSGYHGKNKKPVSYPISSPSFNSGQVDGNVAPNNSGSLAQHLPEDSQLSSRYYTPSFTMTQYDENKAPIKNSPSYSPNDMLVGWLDSNYRVPSFKEELYYYDGNKGIKNSPTDMLVGSKHNLPSFQTEQYDKNTDRFNDNPYSHDNIMQPDASRVSSNHTPPLFDSVHYEDNNVPISYNQYAHNDSQPETSPIRHQKTPLFNLLQFVKKRIPHSYNRNYSKPEVPLNSLQNTSSKWDLDYYKKIFPLDYDPFAHNISQHGASPVVSHDKLPLLYASPYDESNVPINHDPRAKNLSQTEGSPLNSRYHPHLTPIPYNGTLMDKFGLIDYSPEVEQNPLPTWGENNISQPVASPISPHNKSPLFYPAQNEINNVPINYNPRAHNLSQIEAYPSNSNFTPFPYGANGAPVNTYGLANHVPGVDQNHLPYPSNFKPLLFDANGKPLNLHGLPKNFSEFDRNRLPHQSNFETLPFDANGKPLNLHGLPKNFSEFDRNRLPHQSNFESLPFDANGKPLNLHGLPKNFSEFERPRLPYHTNFEPLPFDANGKPLNLHGLPKNFSEFDRNRLPHQSNFEPLPFDANGKPLNLNGLPKNFSEFDRNRLPHQSNYESLPFDANGKPLNLHGLPKNFSEFDRNRLPYQSNFEPLPFDANGKPLNLHGLPKNFSEFDRSHLTPWGKNNVSQIKKSPSNSRYPSNFTPYPHDGTGVPIQYGQINHIPEEEQVSPWALKSKNTVPIYEQVNIDDIILPETLSKSPYNPFPTLMSEKHDKNELPNNEYQNNPYKGYDLNVNDNISTLNPLHHTDQQDEIVYHEPSQQQTQTGNFNDHEPETNSAEDPNNSFNEDNKYGTNSPQQLDASVLDERGSLDGFQYISPSDEDSAHKLDNTNSFSVIPHKNKYKNYSPYPKPNNDPRSQYKITQNTPVGVYNPGSQEEPQNKPQETDAFDDRGAHNGFQYISNSDEESQNKSDHGKFKLTSGGKLDNGLHPPSFSNKDKYSPSPKQELTANPGNDTPIIVDVDSINPDILKLLENANKPLSIEDLINKIDSHKQPQLKPNDSSIPTDLSDDEDELQSRFNDLFSEFYPQLQSNKKITAHPPIDDPEFHLGELDPLELLRLIFPFKFDHAPGKNVEQIPLKDKDLLAMLLEKQNIDNFTKNKKLSFKEQYAAQLPNDSSNKSTKKKKATPQKNPVAGQSVNQVDPRNKGKEVKDLQHQIRQPNITGQAQNAPLQKQTMIISDESLNFPPMQYPDVHIILHHNIGESNALPYYMETDVDGDDFFPDLLHSRIKKAKEQIAECGENTKWVRNCHACSCRRGKASCSQIPDCVLRILEEPMMCKPYSKFKMGCYSCECTGDGIPDCDAYDCEIEAKNKESEEDTGKPHVYHEFFEDVKAKTMLSYYAFFKKLPKDSSEELNYPTCEAGTQWVSNCHNCECKDNLKHECTMIEDCKLDLESLGKPGKCKPNSQFYPKSTNIECQQCSCDDEGNPSCPSADKKKTIKK